ncbi:unnamed protein product, partial [Iphiclides podalirius]
MQTTDKVHPLTTCNHRKATTYQARSQLRIVIVRAKPPPPPPHTIPHHRPPAPVASAARPRTVTKRRNAETSGKSAIVVYRDECARRSVMPPLCFPATVRRSRSHAVVAAFLPSPVERRRSSA